MLRDISQQPANGQAQAVAVAPVKRPWWLWGVCVLVTLLGVGLYLRVGLESVFWRAGNALPRLWEIPAFALVERSGQSVTRADLLGKVWIASVIFTRCVEECPLVSSHMAQLQNVFAAEPDVRLVSITVDPAYDTPEVLTRYAQRFAAQPRRWFFLTGDKVAIYRLVREGFRLSLADPAEPVQPSAVPTAGKVHHAFWRWLTPASALAHDSASPHNGTPRAITHSARLVLVDRQGQVRALYNSADQDALRRVPSDVQLVLRGR